MFLHFYHPQLKLKNAENLSYSLKVLNNKEFSFKLNLYNFACWSIDKSWAVFKLNLNI